MAEAAVNHVLSKLTDALLEKAQELYKVSGQIEQMQTELRLIQGLLRDADSKSNRYEAVREWLNLVREMAYRIENVIDTFLVEIQENSPKSSGWFTIPCCSNCSRLTTVVKNPIKMNKLSDNLNKIVEDLKLIYQRRTDLGITVLGAGSEETVQQPSDQPYRPTKPSDIDESEVVGLEAAKCKIMKQLIDKNELRRTVLSIVGTGGIGKTTLAQKVYKSAELVEQFHYRIWLSISQKFILNDLLREILYSIEPQRKQNPPVTDEDVLEKLKSSLRSKRYLIILDDVWTIDLWDRLKLKLPDTNNASRVIITTRLVNVAKRADRNVEPYRPPYLNDDDGLALLFRKAFQKHIDPESYPRDLLGVAKKLRDKCGGLPLALVVLGGILTIEDATYSAWSKLEKNMNWYDDEGKKCSQVLGMSYEHLPYYLKQCFLYFAAFPANYRISAKHVTRMWVAEEFIPKDGSGTIEDRAERFFQELVQRCLIQVTEYSWSGFCKYCSIHDLLRDLAIHKAKEDNFFTVFTKAEEDVNQLATRKPHRAALQFCTLMEDGVYSEKTRSLLCFGSDRIFPNSSTNASSFRPLNYSGFTLLRVLTIEDVDTTKFAGSDWLKGLIHLRYLGLRYCQFQTEIFKKIPLKYLETIDLKGSRWSDANKQGTTDWSDVVIPNLRHLHGFRNVGECFPLKWDHHTNLQTLKYVDMGADVVPGLRYCINLRTLGINYPDLVTNERTFSHPEEWQTLKGVLMRTEQLASLTISSYRTKGYVPFGDTRDLPCHEKIQSLRLWGELAKDMWLSSVEMLPTNLTKLVLDGSHLKEDPMRILEKLQSLRILQILGGSYLGRKLICSTGGFPNLEKLQLKDLPNLRQWDLKEGAMPLLSHLIISGCNMLDGLPELPNVQIECAELVEQFDCRIWLSISQKFILNDLLREILYSIEPQRKQNPPVTDEDVLEKLKSSLRSKRYLIILDDVWTIDLWDRLKIKLPDTNNASRVIITTRLVNVAKRADRNVEPYRPPYLNDDDGLALLFRKAFQKHLDPESYPRDLLGVAKKLRDKCGGLPLALVVLGDILTIEDATYSAWSKLEKNMNWNDDEGKKCSQVLGMSYEHLPYYLKPCFLYFAAFPENYRISAKRVTRMWVAEEFIPKDGSGTIEDRAERFFQELVQRCLIQVTEYSWSGFCKYCSIHDLLRDLAIHKAKEDNFFTVFTKAEEDVNQLATRKPHRAALQFCTLMEDGVYSEKTRSLLCFGSDRIFPNSSTNASSFRPLNYSGFTLLRVLTIEDVDTTKFAGSDWLKGLIHLRYLGLRYCQFQTEIFKKIPLKYLETIDLKGSRWSDANKQGTTDWSDVVIPNLRHLHGFRNVGECFPLKWDHHTNLQTLKYVDMGADVVPGLRYCINLRTLGINYPDLVTNERTFSHPEEWQTLKGVLMRTEQLASLTISSYRTKGYVPFGDTRDLPCHEKIQSLRLWGELAKDMWLSSVEMLPTNLTKLVLDGSHLKEDPMRILEKLQSLRILQILGGSYLGRKLICSTGGFPNLEKLQLKDLPNLRQWDLKEGAMPLLSHLIISGCNMLDGLPELPNVQIECAELVEQFDCRIWLSISQKFILNDLLREILYSIEPQRKQNPPVTDEDVLEKLKSSLRSKRYLIILDDVWTIDLWDRLKIKLPDTNNASRVIITTRLVNVAKRADRNVEPYRPPYLNDDDGLALLFRKAFQKHLDPESYPRDLLGVAKKLRDKCGGLPLALVVLGDILTIEDATYSAWSKLEKNMNWNDDEGKKCSQVLGMSYEHLPYYLKPCFLYFAAFPENYRISAKRVTRMWVAEEFIPKDGSGTIEDRAERFFQELVQRCLIQVTEYSWSGFCKYCSIHDLLRDLAIHKAKEDNFFTVFTKAEEDVNQLATRKPHRAALQFCTLMEDGVYSEKTRSLLCFGSDRIFPNSSTNASSFRPLNYSGFTLLRVLTIEDVDTTKFAGSDWLKGLIHLRYLGLRYCQFQTEIFKKIPLKYLETIDLKGSRWSDANKQGTTDWSDVVIPNLRHLHGFRNVGECFPLKWDHHTNLQTLKYVDMGADVVPGLRYCINLRTLGINYPDLVTNERTFSHPEEWQTLKGVLMRTEQLASLTISSYRTKGYVPFGDTRDLPCHEKIQSLRLWGELAKDMWLSSVEMLPTNLTKLVLDGSHLKEDPMRILEKLQSLRILQILGGSYLGRKLICSTGGFPNLEKLQLKDLLNLRQWDLKEGAMPLLSHLIISGCNKLRALPELPNVQLEWTFSISHASLIQLLRNWR